jgi:hypothetical protein
VKIYNLTDGIIDYKGRLIPPNGGWVEISDLVFIPDRDKKLDGKYLAFGELPSWWHPPNLIPINKDEEKLELKVEDNVTTDDGVKIDSKKVKRGS